MHLHDNATAMLNEYTNGESPVASVKESTSAMNAQTNSAQKADVQKNDVKNTKEDK